MVTHRCGKADLRLPHALGAALAAPVQKQDDGPQLVVVAAPLLGEIDLEAIGDAVQLDAAIEEAGLLRRLGTLVVRFGYGRAGREGAGLAGRESPGRRQRRG